MDFNRFRREVRTDIFDYQLLAKYLSGLKKPRDKVASLVSEGKILRIKKGLYVFGEEWRSTPLHLEPIANLIYGPSCLSFEYALFQYGLISDRPTVITSLAIGDSKTFETPIGIFEYRAIDSEKFKIGIEYRDLRNGSGYFIASKEKALADLVYRTPKIRTLDRLRHFLFEEMRFDEAMFREFNFQKLEEIAKIYNRNSVYMLNHL